MADGTLYNPGFLGSNFSWWIGQVADDGTWRGNANPTNYKSKDEIPGWGYRYKVRIIGLHDQEEEVLSSDKLPWAQVMYPVTAGGGQGGALQTPNIRQGMFVFGFFLDEANRQVPVIMGVLGNNAQTKLSSTIGVTRTNGGTGSLAASGVANRATGVDSGKGNPEVSDAQVARQQPDTGTKPTLEGVSNPASVADDKQDKKLKEKQPIYEICDKKPKNMNVIQTVIEWLRTKYQELQESLKTFSAAAKTDISDKLKQWNKDIKSASEKIAKEMKALFDKVKAYIQKKISEFTRQFENISLPTIRIKLFNIKIEGFQKICCIFNKLYGLLAGLIAGLLGNIFGKSPTEAVADQTAAQNTAATTGPTTGTAPQAQQATFVPTPACVTEELVANVLGFAIPEITVGVNEAILPLVTEISNANNTYGGVPIGALAEPQVTSVAQQPQTLKDIPNFTNLTSAIGTQAFANDLATAASVLSGTAGRTVSGAIGVARAKDFGDVVNSLGNALGVSPQYVAPAAKFLKDGDIVSGLSSLASIAGVPPQAINVANSLLNTGDIVGGLSAAATALGVDPGLVGQLAGALSAIQQGNIAAAATSLIGNVNIPGLNMDIASGLGFITSLLTIFDCDPEPVCSDVDTYTLNSGVGKVESPPTVANVASVVSKSPRDRDINARASFDPRYDTPSR